MSISPKDLLTDGLVKRLRTDQRFNSVSWAYTV
jgi:hypothetical protein